jgi:hypothetical protein
LSAAAPGVARSKNLDGNKWREVQPLISASQRVWDEVKNWQGQQTALLMQFWSALILEDPR